MYIVLWKEGGWLKLNKDAFWRSTIIVYIKRFEISLRFNRKKKKKKDKKFYRPQKKKKKKKSKSA